MAELLFIATTVFVAYVVFDVVGKKKAKSEVAPVPIKPASTPAPAEDRTEKAAPPAATAKPVSKPKAAPRKAKAISAKSPAPADPVTAPATAVTSDSLKNPKTGEVAKIPGNYAFAKRWIKDALVEEGLLDKVYKNNELDTVNTAKIQAALQQLQSMKKYQ